MISLFIIIFKNPANFWLKLVNHLHSRLLQKQAISVWNIQIKGRTSVDLITDLSLHFTSRGRGQNFPTDVEKESKWARQLKPSLSYSSCCRKMVPEAPLGANGFDHSALLQTPLVAFAQILATESERKWSAWNANTLPLTVLFTFSKWLDYVQRHWNISLCALMA